MRAAEKPAATPTGIGSSGDQPIFGSRCRCANNSSSLAMPVKYQHRISNVRSVGLRPVHSEISMQAMIAA